MLWVKFKISYNLSIFTEVRILSLKKKKKKAQYWDQVSFEVFCGIAGKKETHLAEMVEGGT